MADSNPHSDLTAYEVPKGTIDLPNDIHLPIYPKTATDDFTLATPFSYRQNVSVKSLSSFPYYNIQTRTFSFDLWFPTPTDTALATAQNQLIAQYQHPAGTSQNDLLAATKLIPLPITAYDVFLVTSGNRLLLQTDSRDDGGSFDQGIAIRSSAIKNEQIHQFIINSPKDVAFAIRIYNLMEVVDATTAVAESFSRGVTDAYSKVFGASADPTLIVNRDASDQLKDALQTNILIELHVAASSADASLVTNVIYNYMTNLKPVALMDLQDQTAKIRLYGPDQAMVEIEPQQYKNLTSSWETSNDVMQSLEKTWDDLSDIATHTDTAQSFHQESKNYVDQQGGASGSANVFQMFSGSGSVNLHLNKNTDQLSSTDIHDVSDAKTVLQNSGTNKQEYTQKGYQKWTGQNFSTGSTQIKNLDLQMVSTANLIVNMKAQVSVIAAQGVQPRGYERTIDAFTVSNILQTVQNFMETVNWPTDSHFTSLIPQLAIKEGPHITISQLQTPATIQVDGTQVRLVGVIIGTWGRFAQRHETLVVTPWSYLVGPLNTSIANGLANLSITGTFPTSLQCTLQSTNSTQAADMGVVGIKVWLLTIG